MRRNILLLAAMAVTATLAFLCSCQSDQQGGSSPSKTTAEAQAAEQKSQTQGINEARSELGPKVEKIMGSAPYRYARWGYLEVDPSDGSTVRSLGPANRLYIPGSSTKLFSVSATLDDLGFDHRFQTPVYTQGRVKNGTLHGNLVLVASGDLTLGGRTAPNGTVSYTHIDHTYASSVPGPRSLPKTRSRASTRSPGRCASPASSGWTATS